MSGKYKNLNLSYKPVTFIRGLILTSILLLIIGTGITIGKVATSSWQELISYNLFWIILIGIFINIFLIDAEIKRSKRVNSNIFLNLCANEDKLIFTVKNIPTDNEKVVSSLIIKYQISMGNPRVWLKGRGQLSQYFNIDKNVIYKNAENKSIQFEINWNELQPFLEQYKFLPIYYSYIIVLVRWHSTDGNCHLDFDIPISDFYEDKAYIM